MVPPIDSDALGYRNNAFDAVAEEVARFVLNKDFEKDATGNKTYFTAREIHEFVDRAAKPSIEALSKTNPSTNTQLHMVPEYTEALNSIIENYVIFVATVTERIISECEKCTDKITGTPYYSKRDDYFISSSKLRKRKK